MSELAIRNKWAYHVVLWGLLIACLIILAYLAPNLTNSQNISTDDFFTFWAAGRLNLSGENPYDPHLKDNLQIAVSGHGSTTYPISIMLNPPWAVTMVMPFGLLSYPLSRMVWLIVSIGCIVYSTQLSWRIYCSSLNKSWIAWLVILFFAPMISVLEVGQSTSLILLGISLFLYFTTSRKNDWAAGASLVLAAIKPQVIIIFWISVLFWVIHQHRWKVLLSAILTSTFLTLLAIVFNPSIVQHYLNMVQTGYLTELATPTIGAYLRFFWLGTDKFWLQFIPTIGGIVWFLWYWHNHHPSWSWSNTLPILLLASLVSAPYTYTYDQIILIPAIIQAATWMIGDWKRWSTLIFIFLFLTINILDLVLHMRLSDFWFIWMAPSLLIWYLLIRWQYFSPNPKSQIPVLA